MIDTIMDVMEVIVIGTCCVLIIALIGGAAFIMFGLCGAWQ